VEHNTVPCFPKTPKDRSNSKAPNLGRESDRAVQVPDGGVRDGSDAEPAPYFRGHRAPEEDLPAVFRAGVGSACIRGATTLC
jgi:hypothetical protein